ncbi:MAG: LysM peptidoglycan-binding domain-containing protein [Verrucomicrobiales bacterium]|nr:LysM peptidoglycan-binding domain-containing protein [Verrucomicrobiales bacterium]
MKIAITFTSIGILAIGLVGCGKDDQVLSPLTNGMSNTVAAVGDTASDAADAAGDGAASLANETPAAPEPFSLREGEELISHQVQKGETLSSIAKTYNTRISRIKAANGMSDDTIYYGKAIKVPTKAGTPPVAPPPVAETPSAPPAAPVAPAAPEAPAANTGLAGFGEPATTTETPAPAPVAPAPVAPANTTPPAAPAAPAPGAGTGLPAFNGNGLQFQD